ncbi:LOW QUALITY PROTEIN: interferon-induced very large GTPase 1-like [Megalops cyprinoides]|uniref:LOW QUALITY PROTEIN: interferon-induced very large GTPase 1-like n=1 Tax=Megalops cyprinoides TaxID=118141 RepID=UPI0018642F1E|nr:LOW QUALITY PROTEIN: interferon-induced very large GTPase 1-like [Megalops cyprinoides]
MTIDKFSLQEATVNTEEDLAFVFLHKVLVLDYRARQVTLKDEIIGSADSEKAPVTGHSREDNCDIMSYISRKKKQSNKQASIHPMDVQMAVFHCADIFLRQDMMTKLSACQYALPLLVPDPATGDVEVPLWGFRQIRKSWKTIGSANEVIIRSMPVYSVYTPMVAFFRAGTFSCSKSQLLDALIHSRHDTFFHRHCPGSSRNSLLMDGVVEVAWYCPGGNSDDRFEDCVAFCNLHGDAREHERQREFLVETASVNVCMLEDFDVDAQGHDIIPGFIKSTKPLIFLLEKEEISLTYMAEKQFKIGLKDRNQAEIIKELTMAIKHFLNNSGPAFNLVEVALSSGFRVDENIKDCQKGKAKAENLMKEFEGMEFPKIKEILLPRQGKPWHEWCQKSRDLHHLHGNITQTQSEIHQSMRSLRRDQRGFALSSFLRKFIRELESNNETQKLYFLKWLASFLDKHFESELSGLHKSYHNKWSEVLDLKKKHKKPGDLKEKQEELEKVSQQLSDATCGLEHLMREMGQLYEAWESQPGGLKKEGIDISSLPALAADLMISGHPVELMDGDAAHVPLQWISAVLGKVHEKLGDKQVFVLSVLGIQSTGKSTMLNAMFGLQFAVSAGRCTRGAFMQLVKVAEELRKELGIDYILVVDTEGLRALELAGKATVSHDNELVTFVIGLGNLTLINIFGENPAEMQDTLQIAIQAFLRMKKVKLNPSCMFVHQNVSDISAGEKNMEGKRRLQEKLDEMTCLAAKEEECDMECFNNVIEFDVERDVHYFAQLWEGSPPMAPPNPRYSENIQKLKQVILSVAKKRNLNFSEFQMRVNDLWEALLNENFVFSFKNTFEIAVYRKLENEFGNWTWTLRSAMLSIEDKLHNSIENGSLETVESSTLRLEVKGTYDTIKTEMETYFSEDKNKDILVQWRNRIVANIESLHIDLINETRRKLNEIIQQKAACKELDDRRIQYESELYNRSEELALKLRQESHNEHKMKEAFDSMWEKWVAGVRSKVPAIQDINIEEDIKEILQLYFEPALVDSRSMSGQSEHVPQNATKIRAFLMDQLCKGKKYFKSKRKERHVSETQFRTMSQNLVRQTMNFILEKPVAKMGYNKSYIQEIVKMVNDTLSESELIDYFKREDRLDLLLSVCNTAAIEFKTLHKHFRDANDPVAHLNSKKEHYYKIFKMHCKGKASTIVLADIVFSKLKPSILQAVYDKTAIDVAGKMRADFSEFSGNRSNMEKHFLKSLAEEENFQKVIEYIKDPRSYFENYIRKRVTHFITTDHSVIKILKDNLLQKHSCVAAAMQNDTKPVGGQGVWTWLESFSKSLTNELKFSVTELEGLKFDDIHDFTVLEKEMEKKLNSVTEELDAELSSVSSIRMEMFREGPDRILIKQLCDCCWVQCPFCAAICTHSMKDHPGDHSVPFHRLKAVNGWKYRGTENFCLYICTTVVSSDKTFYPVWNEERSIAYKSYKTAGPQYACWSITPDSSELPYWKWLVCTFKDDFERHYKYKFQGLGIIPPAWKALTKEDAIKSLELV